jgi:hypothetical protein
VPFLQPASPSSPSALRGLRRTADAQNSVGAQSERSFLIAQTPEARSWQRWECSQQTRFRGRRDSRWPSRRAYGGASRNALALHGERVPVNCRLPAELAVQRYGGAPVGCRNGTRRGSWYYRGSVCHFCSLAGSPLILVQSAAGPGWHSRERGRACVDPRFWHAAARSTQLRARAGQSAESALLGACPTLPRARLESRGAEERTFAQRHTDVTMPFDHPSRRAGEIGFSAKMAHGEGLGTIGVLCAISAASLGARRSRPRVQLAQAGTPGSATGPAWTHVSARRSALDSAPRENRPVRGIGFAGSTPNFAQSTPRVSGSGGKGCLTGLH